MMQRIFIMKKGEQKMQLLKNKFVIIIIILLSFQLLYAQDVLTGIKIFSVKWGKKPENVLFKMLDFEPWGVCDFWTYDDEYFYILDTMNKQVKNFTKVGKLIWSIRLNYHPLYIWPLSDSTLVVLSTTWSEKYVVVKIDTLGNVLKKSNLIKVPYSYRTAFLRTGKGYTYVQSSDYVIILDNNLDIIERIKFPKKISLFFNKNNIYPISGKNFTQNPYLKIFKPIPYKRGVKIESETLIEKVNVETSNAIQRLEGVDDYNNFYIKRIFWEDRRKEKYLILKISEEGKEISRKFIITKSKHSMNFKFKIMPNGDIYTQNSNKEEYWIEKYPADWFDK